MSHLEGYLIDKRSNFYTFTEGRPMHIECIVDKGIFELTLKENLMIRMPKSAMGYCSRVEVAYFLQDSTG